MDSQEDARPTKRFKHQSHKDTLKEVHLPSALSQTKFDQDIGDNDSHFHEALEHWRELNLAPAFIKFANGAEGLSSSMPLLLHNWQEVTEMWLSALDVADDEALKALLDLFQKLAHDLRMTLAPKYPDILRRLIQLLPRSLSAPTLTALLATFSALFKYLLIPAVQPELLEQAWSVFRDTLPRCSPEVQRAAAEVWGATLRRLKASSREQCVILIAKSTEGSIADACAWMFVYACKSVSQSLHTAAPSIVAPLLRYHLTCEEPDSTYTLLRRVLTALIHHCKNSEQFTSIADLLVAQMLGCFPSVSEEIDEEKLRRTIEIVTISCSVRQGSRMTHQHLSTLLSQFSSFPLTDTLHSALLKFAAAGLTAGDMALWMGPGRKVVERSWERSTLGIELCGVLSDLAWGGWKSIALPYVLKHSPQLLESHPRKTLELLAALHREKRLAGVDIVWKQKFQSWVDGRLSEWEQTEENVLILHNVLALSDLLPSISSWSLKVINAALQKPGSHAEYEATYANSAWILGACLQCLSERDSSEWGAEADVTAWMTKMAEEWGWSSSTLGGLESLVRASRSNIQTIPLEVLCSSLQTSLLSPSRSLRLNALRLLTSAVVKSSPGTVEVLKRCVQAEEVSLDVQGSRERALRISRLPSIVKDEDDIGANVCCRWLIAQLKVNLRPLWSPAAESLSTLSGRFGDLVWRLLFDELQAASGASGDTLAPEWSKSIAEGDGDDIWEDERSWRDPSAHKMRSVFARWCCDDTTQRAVIQAQIADDRFNLASFEAQLLSTLAGCASLAEKHNRDLVPYFLSIAGPEACSKLPRPRLSAWLTLFSKFSNPKALHSTEILRSLYISLLSHPDRSLQRLALSCLLTYKSPHLAPHEDELQSLLDDTRLRDHLVQLDIAEIEEADRAELVDAMTRLLFGLMLEKRGRSRGTDRRAAILSALGGCTDEELHLLVDLMLQPFDTDLVGPEDGQFVIKGVSSQVSEKQQIGFLTLLGDVLKNLGSRLTSRWPALLKTLLNILGGAQARLDSQKQNDSHEEHEEVDEESDDGEVEGTNRNTRLIRQLGLKRFADFFRCPVLYDFSPYIKESFRAFISPRLDSLDMENTQAPSALLDLFYVWTLQQDHAKYLADFDDRTLPKIYDCLTATSVKPAVLSKVFDIVDRLLSLSAEDEECRDTVLKAHVSRLLTNMSLLVERTKAVTAIADPLRWRQINVLSQVAPYLTDPTQASTLLGLFLPLMRKPSKLVQEKVKVDLANIMCNLFPLIPELADPTSTMYLKTYPMLAQLFQGLRSRQARLSLLSAFRSLANIEPSISSLADLMESLNAYSMKRLNEPDFDRRLGAFTNLNDTWHTSLSCREWLPIIYNMLNFIQDPTELSIRSNASLALKHFIDGVASCNDDQYQVTFLKVLYPGLKNGLHSRNEMVRTEILGVIAYAVTKCENLGVLQEMRVLLAGGDEEADFFNNIHHVQIHRRTRAIRRLADYCNEGHFRSMTLAEVFIPLVGNFIVATDSVDHHLVNESIIATGRMARRLEWGAYYALTQYYLKLIKNRDSSERVYVRTLVAILDNFHFPMDEAVGEDEYTRGSLAHIVDGEEGDEEASSTETPPKIKPMSRVEDAVSSRLLPSLLRHLEKQDETEDSLRIPIAVGVVQIAKYLPERTREPQISRLLTVLSQILRSKSQETRDLTRETLCRIAVILGPPYLPIMLHEMRAALLRGPQLHVLAYAIHSLLVHVTIGEHAVLFDSLDGCVNDVAHVSAEVIFGESGKNVQSEDFKTKMREVRSSSAKAFDSFAIIAKLIRPSKISNLLQPIRNILKETESLKTLQQVDDLLRRIAGGLNSNSHLVPTELLVLSHTLITQNARFLQHRPQLHSKQRKVKSDAIVQIKRKIDTENDHYTHNSFRFVSFGLDLFTTAYRRSRFDFQDNDVLARLEPMVSAIGNTLYSNHIQVVIPGLKAAAAIVKCPLKSIEKSLPVFIRQMIEIIKQAGTTESEAVQATFRSLATILRDQPNAQVKEKDLVYLLELLSPDLEDPSRQASVFTMLRAIISRKFVVPEIYDLMDRVSEIMVTSQSSQVQELCRSVLLQFLLDYPQGKGRLRNQMTSLAKNLSYVYESGRKSVMELLGAIITKFEVGLVREYSDMLFVALVMVIANDDSAKCREMAAGLIRNLFLRLADAQRNVIMSHIHSWAAQYSHPQLAHVSLQICGIIVDLLQKDILPFIPSILEDLNNALSYSVGVLESAMADSEDADHLDQDLEWRVSYHSLVVYSKLLRVHPDITVQPDRVDWSAVITHLVFPHAWTRTAACRLLGLLFAATPVEPPKTNLPGDSPFSVSGMEDVAKKLCLQLRSPNLDAALSLQVVKNLFYVGKCFCAVDILPGASESMDRSADANEQDHFEGEDDISNEVVKRHPLRWLFSKLSYQARHAHIARRNKSFSPENWVHQPASVLKWFAAMVSYMNTSQVELFLTHILSPVYRIAEDDTIRDAQMDELKTLAIELQDLVQTKVGTTKFANVYSSIRQGVLGVRRERRNARVIQATTNPEAAAKRKLQRNMIKKESRKRKARTFA
ncbi:hypothetical protein AcW1_003904 [Taiwanofungus camphoratus]|nr:hypothetical protein AcW1_003904 [Antrodia cinnamomea]